MKLAQEVRLASQVAIVHRVWTRLITVALRRTKPPVPKQLKWVGIGECECRRSMATLRSPALDLRRTHGETVPSVHLLAPPSQKETSKLRYTSAQEGRTMTNTCPNKVLKQWMHYWPGICTPIVKVSPKNVKMDKMAPPQSIHVSHIQKFAIARRDLGRLSYDQAGALANAQKAIGANRPLLGSTGFHD